jgi:hypothetical protein
MLNGAWQNADELKKMLRSDGWKTPNAYCSDYDEPIRGSAVYMFLVHGRDERDQWHDYDVVLVGYVGMSMRLRDRWKAHPVLAELSATRRYIQKWFRPSRAGELRERELALIQEFDPPWNIQGRRRGLLL